MATRGRFLPTSLAETGGSPVDVVLVTGDAYVDHPSFGAAVIGRWLEARGFSAGIVSRPAPDDDDAFSALGRPRLFFGVTAGNLDSMVAGYTSSRRPRSDDPYAPGGLAGGRPDRATLVYTARLRHLFHGVPVVLGGVEASLRRLAHYDWWQGAMRASILADSKADLLVFGMGEAPVLELALRLRGGLSIRECGDIPGTARLLGEKEPLPPGDPVILPSLEEIRADPRALGRTTLMALAESNPENARPLLQLQGRRPLWCNPPAAPLSVADWDLVNELPYTREAHPSRPGRVPALESVRGSILATRGCAGGCAFCSIGLHQGKQVLGRSRESILREASRLVASPGWTGTISDLGGPTANLWAMGCGDARARRSCRRPSCLYPTICAHFHRDHGPCLALYEAVARLPGVRHVFIGSGIRHDLALEDLESLRGLLQGHVGGRLTVAPEHASPRVLRAMRKPAWRLFETFEERFSEITRERGGREILMPYFLAAHPGAGPEDAIALALAMKVRGIRPRQVQLFLPTPGTLSTAMYVSGEDPATGEPLPVARSEVERERHRSLLLYWKREEAPAVREALRAWGRTDLIGSSASCLVGHGTCRERPRGR